ncbi:MULTISPECIES: transglycosylase domain-containing protein, partial [Aeromonas]
EGGNINMMHGDSRVMVVVCLETASLPAPCLSTSTSPRSREEPIFRGIKQGGSTIEQQLVRTITGHYEPTLKRKLMEQLLAISIARKFNKDQIVSAYVQVAYLGTKISGVFELAKCLGLDVFRDSTILSIELSIRLKYPEPSKYSLIWHAKYQRRKNHIINLASKKLPKHIRENVNARQI